MIDELALKSAETVMELADVDDMAAEVYASYSEYLKNAVEYSVASEVPFYKARARQYEMTKS